MKVATSGFYKPIKKYPYNKENEKEINITYLRG
jgi:hypothetical protein